MNVVTHESFVQFSVEGDIGTGSVKLGANDSDRKEDQLNLEVSEGV